MEVLVKRIFNCPTYCISHIYIDGKYICDGIEDTDRMFDDSMSETYISTHKVYAKTAIPTGKYKMTLKVVSPKFVLKHYYKTFCNGKLPRLEKVKGFKGILWHCGNTAEDSAGCLLLGYNKVKGRVINSRQAFENIYNILRQADEINVTYTRIY